MFCVACSETYTKFGHYLTSGPGLAPQILDGHHPRDTQRFGIRTVLPSVSSSQPGLDVLHHQGRTNAAVLLQHEDKVPSIPLVFPPKMNIHHIQWL